MVTKNTENNANNALNILPESASTAVDNDEKYLSFALVLAITIMDNLVKLIGTDGFVLYTYTLQDTATARAVFNELARRLKNFNRQEEVYTTDYLTFRMKYIYGVTLFEHDREGANKQVISSQADSLIKISRIWADFFPANTSNRPI
ncbi:hypothetical protein MMU48_19120, partial [Escherichia coli]|nr:hypothetical protein [Escherichia coli]MCH6214677.1 hypothetical protein [Escherichia coli]MCH6249794.1 hypothetical protein [Escherichia coli]MCH6263197.1 hypothetical protein [Escherichia coli]MCH6292176.1 hypothetical protein [Escherichia coli]